MPIGEAWAETGEVGPAPLFELHCAGCHPSGGNIIRRGKNLKQRALARYGYDEVGEIAALITDGKGLMSAFGDKLSPEEIQVLSQYVLDQAAVNWRH
ncbi:MAG: c-type cytochrome [Cyanobacteria bacterium P01_G01_bin.38]